MSGKKGQKSELSTEVKPRFTGDFLETMDGRTDTARTLRQRLAQLVADLGGFTNLSYQEQSICKRIVHIERLIEKDELSMAHNRAVDKHAHFAAINTLTSLFSKIGMKRRARKIPSLEEYLKQPSPDPPSGAITNEET